MEEKLEDEYMCRGIEISSSIDGAKFTDDKRMVIARLKLPYPTLVEGSLAKLLLAKFYQRPFNQCWIR